MMVAVFQNGRVFAPGQHCGEDFLQAMVIKDGRIVHVGSDGDREVREATAEGAAVTDLQQRIVIPSFIDGHVHMLMFGLSLRKVNLLACASLEEIRAKIISHAESYPAEPRILCRGWIQSSTNGVALASMLDDLDPRPIYVEAFDLHSTWCNTAAIAELGLTTAPDPPGGTIHRDEHGRASGLLSEATHLMIVCPYLERVTPIEEKLRALEQAAAAYTSAGYTGMVDMAMDESTWEILQTFRKQRSLPFHIAAHWLIPYSENQDLNFKNVDRAIAMWKEFNPNSSPEFCIVGIKVLCDGVVDGCTAALSQPYARQPNPIDPIWPIDQLRGVVQRADQAGVQCAIHAIGDEAVKQAIDVLSQVGTRGRRHRIEHLELTSPEDARRLGELGITASVQPVHSDPALFGAWPTLVGPERCKRAFAYKDFADGGAPIAFGTDSPTAAHFPLPNLYNATTRRSAIQPESRETVNPHFGLSLAAAVSAATSGAAYSRHADAWTGRLQSGMRADFAVLDMQWTPEALLDARVRETWFGGRKVYDVDAVSV